MDTELEKLQAAFSTAYADFVQAATKTEATKRNQPGVCGDWSPKEVIAHLNGWDNLMFSFINNPDAFEPPDDLDTFNAKSVSAREKLLWDEMLFALHTGFQALQATIASVTTTMHIYKRVYTWLQGRIEDYQLHTGQLRAWI